MKEESSPQHLQLDITWTALFRILAFVVGIWAIITLKEVLIMLFGVFIFVAAVNPIVSRWQKHMSRVLAVALFYTLLFGSLVIATSVFVPSLVRQINDLIHALPTIIERSRPFFDSLQANGSLIDQTMENLRSNASQYSQSFLQTTVSIFGGLATIFTGLVLSFYLLLEEKNAKDFFHQVLPQNRFEPIYKTVSKISERMGSWVRGQLLLMAIIGFTNLVIYIIIDVPSPLPLAIWAGLCEAIPYIGPALGVLPALIVAVTTGTLLQAVLVLILGFFLVQQLEAHVVVPKVMGKAVGLSPVLVILALAVGVKFLGLVGAILAIPVAAIISVIVGEWPSIRKIWDSEG